MKNYVFLGDSVTDCSRKRSVRHELTPQGLGTGWVQYVRKTLVASNNEVQVWNRGYSGSLTKELLTQDRWWPAVEKQPVAAAVSSLMIGINDIWHPFWRGSEHSLDAAANAFRAILLELKSKSDVVIAAEPIALPIGDVTQHWWPLLSQLDDAQEQICTELNVLWLPLQASLMKSSQGCYGDYLSDGVHPTDLGHRWIAKQWINFAVEQQLVS